MICLSSWKCTFTFRECSRRFCPKHWVLGNGPFVILCHQLCVLAPWSVDDLPVTQPTPYTCMPTPYTCMPTPYTCMATPWPPPTPACPPLHLHATPAWPPLHLHAPYTCMPTPTPACPPLHLHGHPLHLHAHHHHRWGNINNSSL